uniref:BTB domain-containing protein n=1 Tax=Onchocerca volvulus TaxID=6282 RepID=A0A8R1XYV0_ONCVO
MGAERSSKKNEPKSRIRRKQCQLFEYDGQSNEVDGPENNEFSCVVWINILGTCQIVSLVSLGFRKDVIKKSMGALNSNVRKGSRSDWIAPTSMRKCDSVQRNRLTSLIHSKYFTEKLANFRWRRKYRQISREDRRAFCDLISHWTNAELVALLTEMESACGVRELISRAEEARPSTSNLAADLLNAWKNEIVSDCVLIHKGFRYAAHSFILQARCHYFSDFWDSMITQSSDDAKLEISFMDNSISSETFQAMLYYIYSGEYDESLRDLDRQSFNIILERYGCGSSLSSDMMAMDSQKGECTLIFTTGNREETHSEECNYRVKCSGAVLAARSSYLRSVIEKRFLRGEKLEIVINEYLFPRTYARIILDAIYSDRLDLSKMPEGCQVSVSSLSEVQAIASGQQYLAPLRHAIDIFHIAQFLNLSYLTQACEDIIVAQISIETVGSLWNWACEPGGSAYVRRHCIAFLRSDFSRICSSHLLFELEEDLLKGCLLSDYVQCAEVKILETVIRWGEHELVRRMEEREPNLIANTTHSISRKGIRRSELNDEELKSILTNLLPLVRIDYILPPFHQSLNAAYKRGLLDRSPHMDLLGQCYPDSRSPDVNPDAHWFDHSVPRRHAGGPRLLLPYIIEVRKQLKRLCKNGGNASYAPQQKNSIYELRLFVNNLSPEIISENLKLKIEKRVKQLAEDDLMKKISFCGCSHHLELAIEQIRLRVLRELNIDDECVEVLCICSASKRDRLHHYNYSQPTVAIGCDAINTDVSLSSTALSDYGI